MSKILALAGKKQSGKNTAANWILGYAMLQLNIIQNRFDITEDGKLRISDLFGNEDFYGVFDYYHPHPKMTD